MFKIIEINNSYNDKYREKLWKLLWAVLTKFNNEIFFIIKNQNSEEIWFLRLVYNFEEKYYKEYLLEDYIWKNIWFFTWIFIKKDFRRKWLWTKLFNRGYKKFEDLWQNVIFSDARDTSLWIFEKNNFEKKWIRVSPEGYKETIVIKKI